jgi:hypothetical protein
VLCVKNIGLQKETQQQQERRKHGKSEKSTIFMSSPSPRLASPSQGMNSFPSSYLTIVNRGIIRERMNEDAAVVKPCI